MVIAGDTAIAKDLRVNEQIRISPIRLIDENDGQVGIVETREALLRAREAGLDLVEVAPQSKPPVCRIMDYGKWKYAQRKKEQKSKAHRHETELKEIRIKTPKIDPHDLGIKINHAREFLERGDRVQFTLRFRARELAHVDLGVGIFARIKETLSDIGKIERDCTREGRRITMLLGPGGKKPAEKPVQKPAQNPAEKPPEKPAEKPVQKPAQTPAEKPAEKPAQNPAAAS